LVNVPEVRRALALAIDAEALVTVLPGSGARRHPLAPMDVVAAPDSDHCCSTPQAQSS